MPARTRILLVSHDLSRSGAPVVLLGVAKFLLSKQYDIDVWGLSGGELYNDFVELGIVPHLVRNSRRAIRDLYIKTNKKYDYIICNTIESYKAIDVLHRFCVPTIWYIHESGYLEEYIQKNKDFKRVFEHFYNIYACSKYSAKICQRYNKISEIRIIPNCVDDAFVSYSDHKEIRFGVIGRVSELKGIDVLVSAFKKLVLTEPQTRLYIAGDTQSEFAQNLIQANKNIKQISWLGVIKGTEKQKFFDSINVLCVPSVYDSAPISLLEGLMYGKPIITTTNVGNNNLVSEQCGFIVSVGDTDGLYKSMKWFCDNKHRVPQMMQDARAQYLSGGNKENQELIIEKMLADNTNNLPIINTKIRYEIIEKIAPTKNTREILFFGHRFIRYKKSKK